MSNVCLGSFRPLVRPGETLQPSVERCIGTLKPRGAVSLGQFLYDERRLESLVGH
jgi:hypothetical protein